MQSILPIITRSNNLFFLRISLFEHKKKIDSISYIESIHTSRKFTIKSKEQHFVV